MFSSVCVVGLGYIGLPTAAILASRGLNVIGVDVKADSVDAINSGRVPFVEPNLQDYVAKGVSEGNLKAYSEPRPADAFIIAVPTPFKSDKSADLSYIEQAGEAIAPHLKGGELVVLESTSPPKATNFLADVIFRARPDLDRSELDFAHCPERVLPGQVMIELVENDRIVGGLTEKATERAAELYRIFCEGEVLLTDAVTAEMAKLVENSFRDVNIAFANELSLIADDLGINVWELIELANHHPRVNILQPGPGVGGHCIAVDPWFIVSSVPDKAKLIRQAREINDSKPDWVIAKVDKALQGVENPVIAALGLAFKANIDDLRESPALAITARLAEAYPQAQVLAVEPNVGALPSLLRDRANVALAELTDALATADVVVILVDHDEFKTISLSALPGKQVIDTRGILKD